jgi:TatD DNase family protein
VTPFVDSHAHLADPAFDADRDEVVARARATGAVAVVAIGESIAAAERAEMIAAHAPNFVWWTTGVHPHAAASYDPATTPDVLRAAARRGAVAIGECGLDYHYDHSPPEVQRRVFDAQLSLAAELLLPVVMHSREAEADTIALVQMASRRGVRGVAHCFTGSRDLATSVLDAGWMISFSGIVTFRAWTDDDLIRFVPQDRLLVETDAPYLAPVPHRGKRNEPAFAALTCERLAAARGLSPKELGLATCRNAASLFGLALALPED